MKLKGKMSLLILKLDVEHKQELEFVLVNNAQKYIC